MVLAMRVRFRAAVSGGNSCVKLKRLGDKIAGHKNRRKMDALIKLSLISFFLLSSQCWRKLENTAFSSLKRMRKTEINIESVGLGGFNIYYTVINKFM